MRDGLWLLKVILECFVDTHAHIFTPTHMYIELYVIYLYM